MHLSKLLTGCLFVFIFSSCEKVEIPADEQQMESYRSLRANACSEFNYSSNTFYLRNTPADYIEKPVTALTGTFGATPYGLAIDPKTGAINVSASETGLNYTVFFVKTGTSDTCTRNITIAGVDFANSLYTLSQNETQVAPTFNGISSSLLGNSSIAFDVPGIGNLKSLRSLGIAIDPQTGTIDLKKTLDNGLLGFKPVNGASVIVRLNYRVNDASQGALNHIDLRFSYYASASDVPANLMKKIKPDKKIGVAGAREAADDGGTKPRPPEIVIVGG